ncbi:hypothetical protein ACFX1S_009313 [Malus domestica]
MGFQRLKRRAQKSKKPIKKLKNASVLKSWACSQTTDSRYRRAPAFSKVGLAHKPPIPDIEECHLLSLVSTRHTQTQLCENHGQFVEAPIPTICLSQPRQHLSHAEKAVRKSLAVCRSADSNHLSFSASSALRKSRAICRRFLLK